MMPEFVFFFFVALLIVRCSGVPLLANEQAALDSLFNAMHCNHRDWFVVVFCNYMVTVFIVKIRH